MMNGFQRVAAPSGTRMDARHHVFPSPVRGLVESRNLTKPLDGSAARLENFFPTQTGIRVRGGARKHATIGGTGGVVSLIPYAVSGPQRRLFAASDNEIYDVSSPADPDVAPPAVVTGQTKGYYSHAQFATSGGIEYLYLLNGGDAPQLYDGTSWTAITATSTPSLSGVATDKLSAIWTYRNRLFFIEGGTMVAWFLPVNNIGGVLSDLSLEGVFQNGGSLLFGTTWSMDAGDGMDDKCVFVTTEGEVAVYEGSDPGSAADWRLVGVYKMARPLGPRAFMRAGGDVAILTSEGMVPLTAAIQKDRSALRLSAITEPIADLWAEQTKKRGSRPWEVLKWPDKNMALVSQPASVSDSRPMCLVVNTLTGAWAKYTGWDTSCLGYFDGAVYYGDSNGYVYECESGGSDNGAPFTAVCVLSFNQMGSAQVKVGQLLRATFLAGTPFMPEVSLSVNYNITLPPTPSAAPLTDIPVWDTAIWDTAVWDGGAARQAVTRWRSVYGAGFAIAPQIQITSGASLTPDIELVSVELTYATGGSVV